MDSKRLRRLEEVMQRMAAGDTAAVWMLINEFDAELHGAVRHQLASLGRADLISDSDVVDGLVVEVALLLFGSRAWRPGGALPWVWAEKAIRQLVNVAIGHRAASVDEQQTWGEELEDDRTPCVQDTGFDELAESNASVSKLRAAISQVGSARDQQVHIDYQMQRADGDPSPSHTVAHKHGLQAANVRQIDRRIRLKIQNLANSDDEFNELKDLPWVA